MRESRLYGFVRGALSNERPYRVKQHAHAALALIFCRPSGWPMIPPIVVGVKRGARGFADAFSWRGLVE